MALYRSGVALRRAAAWTLAGGLPFVFLTALFNAHVTGSPLRFPLQAADRLDTFGFGRRNIAQGQPTIDYTRHVAFSALSQNARSMPHWLAGAGIGLLLAIVGGRRAPAASRVVATRRRRRPVPARVSLLVGHVPLRPRRRQGARPALLHPPRSHRWPCSRGGRCRDLADRSLALSLVVLAAVLAGSMLMLPTILRNAHDTTELLRAKATPLTAPALRNVVVVMQADPAGYSLLDFPFLVGDPRLHDRVLYTVDHGPASVRLAQLFPTCRLYQFVQRTEPGHPLLKPSYIVEPMRIVSGAPVQLRFEATNNEKLPVVVAQVAINGRTVATQVLDRSSHAGATTAFDVVLGTSATSARAPRPATLFACVARRAGLGRRGVRSRRGQGAGRHLRAPLRRSAPSATGSRYRHRACSTTDSTSGTWSGCDRTSKRTSPNRERRDDLDKRAQPPRGVS